MRNRITSVVRRSLDTVEKTIAALGQAGLGSVIWPGVIGIGLSSLIGRLSPDLAKALHPKFGAIALAAGSISLVLAACALVAWLGARRRAAQGGQLLAANEWGWGSQQVQRWTLLLALSPLVIAALGKLDRKHPFMVLGLAGLAAVVVGYFAWLLPEPDAADESPSKSRFRDRIAHALVGTLTLAYTATFSTLSILNHISFKTSRADLAYYVSIFRRSSLGDLLGCTICGGGNHLSGHFDPILVLLSPLYWIYPEAETLLVLQSALLGSGMIPLYLIGRHQGLSRTVALVVCAVYGLHPALHGVNLFDFHSLALLIPAALWVWWAWERGSTKLFLLFFGIMLLVREDAALVGLVLCVCVALSGRSGAGKLGFSLGLGCVAYFAFVKGVLMTHSSGGDPIGKGYEHYYSKLVERGTGTKGLVNSVFGRPDRVLKHALTEAKMQYWLQLLVPVCFVPLLARRGKLMLVYGAAFTLLASRSFVYSIHFHYSSVVLPFLFALAASGLAWVKELPARCGFKASNGPRLTRAVSMAMLGAALMCSWKFGAILPNSSFRAGLRAYDPTPGTQKWKRYKAMKQVCRIVPAGASVATDSSLLPHLGRCSTILRKRKRALADYLVWRGSKGKTTPLIRAEVRAGLWKPIKNWDDLTLYENTVEKKRRSRKKFERLRRAK